MAALAALGRRLRALGRAVGCRGVQNHPGAPPVPPNPAEAPPAPQTPPAPPKLEESTADYAFVERLLPPTRIPDPPPHPSYPTPSGWSPPKALPYFVRRSRLHNLPVYPRLVKGNRRLTELRRIEGDIWALERELREFLGGPKVEVNEVTGTLRLKGSWERELREWLLQRGF